MPDFTQIQRTFAAHIRNPQHNPAPPDVEAQRMAVYCELFYNNVQSLLASTYPVLRKLLPDTQWHDLIKDYFANHEAHTPLFAQIPTEFLRYLEEEREPQPQDPPFLWELAHYEWAELGLSIDSHELDWQTLRTPDDLFNAHPRLSPLAWIFAYRYPVHQISPTYQPTAPPAQATYLALYRDPDDEVHFLELNPVSARLLALIDSANGQQSARALLSQICTELQHPQPEIVLQGGHALLRELYAKHLLYA